MADATILREIQAEIEPWIERNVTTFSHYDAKEILFEMHAHLGIFAQCIIERGPVEIQQQAMVELLGLLVTYCHEIGIDSTVVVQQAANKQEYIKAYAFHHPSNLLSLEFLALFMQEFSYMTIPWGLSWPPLREEADRDIEDTIGRFVNFMVDYSNHIGDNLYTLLEVQWGRVKDNGSAAY